MEIVVAWTVTVEAYSVEEAIGYDLEEEAMDAEDKVAKANVVAVAVDKEDIMKMKGNTLTLIFTAYQTISTLKITFDGNKWHNKFTQDP